MHDSPGPPAYLAFLRKVSALDDNNKQGEYSMDQEVTGTNKLHAPPGKRPLKLF